MSEKEASKDIELATRANDPVIHTLFVDPFGNANANANLETSSFKKGSLLTDYSLQNNTMILK